ncbi:unnamed protein product [Soboliphyme baturini]|uniref:Secreted protein n=1 Tax=Soboliphyme baturini TaxID=241478 RepID=A0A183IUC7_9BILA|nr:unnamed protein product [Soboliphyme baturini]
MIVTSAIDSIACLLALETNESRASVSHVQRQLVSVVVCDGTLRRTRTYGRMGMLSSLGVCCDFVVGWPPPLPSVHCYLIADLKFNHRLGRSNDGLRRWQLMAQSASASTNGSRVLIRVQLFVGHFIEQIQCWDPLLSLSIARARRAALRRAAHLPACCLLTRVASPHLVARSFPPASGREVTPSCRRRRHLPLPAPLTAFVVASSLSCKAPVDCALSRSSGNVTQCQQRQAVIIVAFTVRTASPYCLASVHLRKPETNALSIKLCVFVGRSVRRSPPSLHRLPTVLRSSSSVC